MKIGISALNSRETKIGRKELVQAIKNKGDSIIYLGLETSTSNYIHPDYKKYDVHFQPIPLERSNINPLKEISSITKLIKILKINKLDSLIVYGIRTFPTLVISSKLAGVKRIVCIVNGSGRLFRLKGWKGYLARTTSYPMLWLSFYLANKVLFQNSDDLEMIRKKGLLIKKNYEVINGSGVNLQVFEYTSLEATPVFLMIGRLTGDKGVNEFVQAAKIVKEEFPSAIFNLVGPMDDLDSSLNMEQLNEAVNKEIINLQSKIEDVKPEIRKCRVFVLPSYYEGTPRTVLEAMAMGRPIITTETVGCRETVIEGVNGFKVPVKDTEILALKMKWMILNPNEVEKMGQESRRIAEEKYDVYKVNEKILNAASY